MGAVGGREWGLREGVGWGGREWGREREDGAAQGLLLYSASSTHRIGQGCSFAVALPRTRLRNLNGHRDWHMCQHTYMHTYKHTHKNT